MISLKSFIIMVVLSFASLVASQEIQSAEGPRAVIEANKLRVHIGEEVIFDGGGSRPGPGGKIVSLVWDFDPNDRVLPQAAGEQISHYFNHVGAYQVSLMVEDDKGRQDYAFIDIEVFPDLNQGPSLTANFDGGKSGILFASPHTFSFMLEWGNQFYFRLDNVKNKSISLRIDGHGPQRQLPASVTPYPGDHSFSEKYELLVNTDYQSPDWQILEGAEYSFSLEPGVMTVSFTPEEESIYLAYAPPYGIRNLNNLIDRHKDHEHFEALRIGSSVEGRPLWQLKITDPNVPDRRKYAIWITATAHGYEMAGGQVCQGIISALLAADNEAAEIRKKFVFNMVPLLNPDAVAHGGYRYNMHDVDLNRNWDDVKKDDWDRVEAEPEVAAVKKAIANWVGNGNRLDMYFDFHCFTPIEDRMALYLAKPDNIPPEVSKRQELFAAEFCKKWDWRSLSRYSQGTGIGEISRLYARRTGVLSITPEHALGYISRQGQNAVRNTPAMMRELGRDYVRLITEFLPQQINLAE